MTGRYEFYDNFLTDGKVYGKYSKKRFEKFNVISQIIFDNYKFSQEFIDGLKEIGIHQKLGLKIFGGNSFNKRIL